VRDQAETNEMRMTGSRVIHSRDFCATDSEHHPMCP
jgi:hypothetical protein